MMNMLSKIHRWIFEACIIMLMQCGVVSAWAYTPQARSQYLSGYTGYQTRPTTADMHTAVPPTYQFNSTTNFTSAVGRSNLSSYVSEPFAVNVPGSIRRGGSWDDPDDEEVGVLPTTPIGEPLVLLLLALLYITCRTIIRKQTARE